jgi:hypothetical protein
MMLNSLGTLVEAHRGAEFELGRQGDPKLKAARPCRLAGTAAMPHAAAGLHPLDAAGGQHARCAVRVLIAHVALSEVGEGDHRKAVDMEIGERAEDYISLRQILATIEHEISLLLPAGDVKPDLGGGGSSTEVIGFGEPGPRPNQP